MQTRLEFMTVIDVMTFHVNFYLIMLKYAGRADSVAFCGTSR